MKELELESYRILNRLSRSSEEETSVGSRQGAAGICIDKGKLIYLGTGRQIVCHIEKAINIFLFGHKINCYFLHRHMVPIVPGTSWDECFYTCNQTM